MDFFWRHGLKVKEKKSVKVRAESGVLWAKKLFLALEAAMLTAVLFLKS